MKIAKIILFNIGSLLFLPLLSFASQPRDFKSFVVDLLIKKLIDPATAIVVTLIMIFFFYNSAMFIFKSEASAKEKNKFVSSMIWSVLIMFMIVSIWGIVKMIAGTLTLETSF